MIKNIVFDIDGTLSQHGKPISSHITKQIRRLLLLGINICFASARPYRDIVALLEKDLHHLPIVGCNGGTIFCDRKPCTVKTLSSNLTEKMVDLLDDMGIAYLVDGLHNYFIGKYTHPFHDYMTEILGISPCEKKAILKEGITKILILSDEIDAVKMTLQLNDISIENLKFSFHTKDSIFDITPSDVNKLSAVISLAYNLDETAAFGNDINDVCLLEKVKYPFVVGKELQLPRSHYHINSVSDISDWISQLPEMDFLLPVSHQVI